MLLEPPAAVGLLCSRAAALQATSPILAGSQMDIHAAAHVPDSGCFAFPQLHALSILCNSGKRGWSGQEAQTTQRATFPFS